MDKLPSPKEIQEIHRWQESANTERKHFNEFVKSLPAKNEPPEAKINIPFTESIQFEDQVNKLCEDLQNISDNEDVIIGKMQKIENNTQALEQQNIELKRIADAAQAQADLAIAQANEAKHESFLAKLKANKAFIVSVLSVVVVALSNADKMISNIRTLLSYLSALLH